MATLNARTKRFIVMGLACYDTPTQVAKRVKEEFKLDVDRHQVGSYDPTTVKGAELSRELRELFFETRKKFKAEFEDISVANQAFRLRSIARMFEAAEAQGNRMLAAQLLEQAAKEMGGAFTNRRELGGAGGAPIQVAQTGEVKHTHMHELSDAQLDRVIRGDFSALGG